MKKLLYFIAFMVAAHAGFAQVLFTAEANRYKVAAGETFTVTFTINTESGDFKYPNFSGFRIVSGPMTGFSTTVINGRMSQEKTASFDLLALKTGTYTIDPATVKANGETYKTKPITIEVVAERPKPQGGNSPEDKAAELAQVKILTNKRTVYVGEPLAARYTLILKTNIGSFDFIEEPEFQNFIKNEIELKRIETQQEVIDGERVTTADFRKFVLIPQQAGTISPGTLRMRIPTQVPTGRTDWFGRQEVTTVNQLSASTFPTITVKPLPESGKPADFSGGVGSYKLYVSLSRNEVKADESITLTVEIAGSGNLQTLELPAPNLPNSIESYDPKYKESISVKTSGVSGFKRNEYLLLPRYKGVYKIPALTFSFFDVDKGQYVTLTSDELEVNVTEGPQQSTANDGSTTVQTDKTSVAALGEDILFIHTTPSAFALHQESLFASSTHKRLLIAALVIILAMFGFARLRSNYRPDRKKQAQRNAGFNATKQLKQASSLIPKGDVKGFYAALTAALQQYFAQKFNVAAGDFNRETVAAIIQKKGGSNALVSDTQQLLAQADMARFAPLTQANMQADVEKAKRVLENLEKL
jgi:hypothetical protein